jgi:hypothetical protein
MSKLKTTQMTMQATQDAQTGMIANLKDKNNKYMNSIKEITRTNTYLKKERENQARELAAAELQVKKLAAQQLDLQNKISAQGVTSMKKEKAAAVLQKQKEYELHQLTVTHEKLATDNDRLTVESIELKRALKEAVTELETVRVTAAVPKRRRRPPA